MNKYAVGLPTLYMRELRDLYKYGIPISLYFWDIEVRIPSPDYVVNILL